MAQKLKKQFIELLEKDVEFRYTVAGYLGLSEIIKRLDTIEQEIKRLWEGQEKLWQGQEKLWENQNKLWQEVKSLREGQEKLWEELRSLREGQNKLWEEVRSLRENQEKLWEGQNRLWESNNRLWEEVRSLREGQEKLWEGQNKLWEEVRSLREGQEKLWEGQNRLWEGQNKLWEEVRSLREGLNKLWESHMRLEKYVRTGFEGLRKALHVTFEDYSRSFVQLLLEEIGYGWREVDRKILVSEGRPVEIDIFCEEPLVVGEATSFLGSWEEAERELAGLEERVGLVSTLYGRRPELILLCVGRAAEEVVYRLKNILVAQGVRLVLGAEIREAVV
ncbi:MAG: hypothetical protein QW801_01890 [Candidatus Caldarchaeum sp.]